MLNELGTSSLTSASSSRPFLKTKFQVCTCNTVCTESTEKILFPVIKHSALCGLFVRSGGGSRFCVSYQLRGVMVRNPFYVSVMIMR